jgi:hypothetical protein
MRERLCMRDTDQDESPAHPTQFPDDAFLEIVIEMLQHVGAQDEVERRIGKGQTIAR